MNCLPACGVSIDYISQFYLCVIRFFFLQNIMNLWLMIFLTYVLRNPERETLHEVTKIKWIKWLKTFGTSDTSIWKTNFVLWKCFFIHNLHMRNQCIASIIFYAWHFATNVNNWWEKYNTNGLFKKMNIYNLIVFNAVGVFSAYHELTT